MKWVCVGSDGSGLGSGYESSLGLSYGLTGLGGGASHVGEASRALAPSGSSGPDARAKDFNFSQVDRVVTPRVLTIVEVETPIEGLGAIGG